MRAVSIALFGCFGLVIDSLSQSGCQSTTVVCSLSQIFAGLAAVKSTLQDGFKLTSYANVGQSVVNQSIFFHTSGKGLAAPPPAAFGLNGSFRKIIETLQIPLFLR